MTVTTPETLRTVLEGALDEVDDPEVAFKLRTAIQLLDVIEEQHAEIRDALSDADVGAELRANLQTLGYIE